MRYATILLVALSAMPCFAQERIFHASPIDIEQNARLDALEARLAVLEQAPQVVIPPLPTPPVKVVQPKKQVAAAATCPSGQCPVQPRVAAATVTHSHPHPHVATPAQDNYQARWKNYDGLSFRQHAEIMHGINTAGMSDSQVARLRDHDHDTFGGGHPPAMRARTHSYTQVAAQQQQNGCPDGKCPYPSSRAMTVQRSTTVQSRGGLLGFGILGRRR